MVYVDVEFATLRYKRSVVLIYSENMSTNDKSLKFEPDLFIPGIWKNHYIFNIYKII